MARSHLWRGSKSSSVMIFGSDSCATMGTLLRLAGSLAIRGASDQTCGRAECPQRGSFFERFFRLFGLDVETAGKARAAERRFRRKRRPSLRFWGRAARIGPIIEPE